MSLAGATFLRDLVERLEEPAPANDVQVSYAEQHPKPERKPHRKTATGSVHGNARVVITIDGVTKSAHAWAKERGLVSARIHSRLRYRWHPTAAVFGTKGETRHEAHTRLSLPVPDDMPCGPKPGTPKAHGNAERLIEVDGVTMSAGAWSKAKGWERSKVHNRINCGWDAKCAVLAPAGMGKEAAHAKFKRPITFVCPTKSHRVDEPTAQHTRVVPSRSEHAVICMDGGRIAFAGSYRLTPDKADELALNLIRMAADVRTRMGK